MRPNKTKAKLLAGEVAIGYILNIPSPDLVEVAGLAGLDFVVIDCEHGPMGEERAEAMIRAAEVVDITPLVRVPANRPEVILRFLDRGAAGVVVPHINTPADAAEVVAAVKYAPDGNRGYAAGRWTLGISGDPFEFANRELLVACMVEEQEGIDNLDAILDVPGVDVIHIGANDLSQSLGYRGKADDPHVREAIRTIVTTTVAHGKAAGLGGNRVNDYASIRERIDQGVRFITVSPTALLQLASRTFRTEVTAQTARA